MSDDEVIPVWTLPTSNATNPVEMPSAFHDMPSEGFTPERLERLRRVLAVYADNPPVLLERHAVTVAELPPGGRVVAASSPILKTLNDVVGASKSVTAPERAAGATGVLYRMVVPKEVAGDLAAGLARPMTAAGGGQYSAIMGKAGIVAQARYVPVASAGGATGAAATATTAAGVGGAAVAAAPVVILLAATAASIYAEEQRRQALEQVQTTLDEMRREGLEKERDQLNGAVKAIAKATAVLADEGRLGHSLGLDASAHAIDTALSTAERRLKVWERKLADLGKSATPGSLKKAFPGIDEAGGEFRAELRMVGLAIAAKRRVAVLQAAEHTQINPDLSLSRFAQVLQEETEDLNELEARLAALLRGVAELAITPPKRARDLIYTRGEVRDLLKWGPRLQRLAASESPGEVATGDVEIAIVVPTNGPARVLEPVAGDSSRKMAG